MKTDCPNLVRKDIARMLSVSERTVRRHEAEWGLNAAKVTITTRIVRFYGDRAVFILKQRGFL